MQNVVLICLDSVRKDIYEEEMTKTKELVDISLDGCRATSSWSVPSHASFLTAQLPHEHGVHSHSIDFSSLSKLEVLTSRVPFERTVSISANQFTSVEFGFDQWFDECHTVGSTSYYPKGLDVRATDGIIDHFQHSIAHDQPLKSFVNGVVSAIIKVSDRLPIRNLFDNGASNIKKVAERSIMESPQPCFCFLNLMEAHHPHRLIRRYNKNLDVPKRWSSSQLDLMDLNKSNQSELNANRYYIENFRSLYQAAVDYLDRRVSEFVKSVQQQSGEDITFIITADHGENLGHESDDYLFGHTASLSEGLLHVPLDIINPPDCVDVERDHTFSQRYLRDIIEAIAHEKTVSLPEERYVPAELVGGGLLQDPDEYWDRMIRCVYDIESQIKIVWDSVGNSYHDDLHEVDSDRADRTSIDTVPEWATEQFEVEITEYKRRAKAGEQPTVGSLEEGTKNRLEELGYL